MAGVPWDSIRAVLFPTTDFAIFFVLVFLGHWLLNHEARWWKPFMLLASYVFYGWWDPRYVVLLAVVSAIARGAAIAVGKQQDDGGRLRVMARAGAAHLLGGISTGRPGVLA